MRRPLDLADLRVTSFETSRAASAVAPATDPVTDPSEPNTWEDTCIKMCPTDDTCTILGCTR